MRVAPGAQHPHADEDLRDSFERLVRVLADQVIRASGIVGRTTPTDQQLPGHLVERHVRRDRVADPFAEGIRRRFTQSHARVLQQIAPLQRPVIDELGPSEQGINGLGPLAGFGVGDKLADLVRRRLQTDQIERHAAQKFLVTRQRGRRDFEIVQLRNDVLIDEVAGRHRRWLELRLPLEHDQARGRKLSLEPRHDSRLTQLARRHEAGLRDIGYSLGVDVEDRQLGDIARRTVGVLRDQLQAVLHPRLDDEPLGEDADGLDFVLVFEIRVGTLLDPLPQDRFREAAARDADSAAMRHIADRLRQQQTLSGVQPVDATPLRFGGHREKVLLRHASAQ